MKINTPHNNLCIKVLRVKAEARRLFKHFLDKDFLKQLDLRTLKLSDKSFTDDGLKEYFSDLLYSCKWKGKNAYLHLMVEHKSSFDRPKLQVLCYLALAYRQQRLQHEAENQERKDNDLPTLSFDYQFIFPIILYHGKERFLDIPFSHEFEQLDEYSIQFVPDVKMFVIDLSKYSDAFIEELGKSFLLPMLLLFKHKADKEFVKQHYEKIFIFVEQTMNADQIREFIQAFVKYIFQTFSFEKKEMRDWLPVLPSPIQTEFMSTYDILIQAGLEEGLEKGKQAGLEEGLEKGKQVGLEEGLEKGKQVGLEEGLEKGKQVGLEEGKQAGLEEGLEEGTIKGALRNEIQMKLEFLIDLLTKLSVSDNNNLAEVTRMSIADIKIIKKFLKKGKKKKFKAFVQDLFSDVPLLTEKDWLEIDKLAVSLFKKYKKAAKKKKI